MFRGIVVEKHGKVTGSNGELKYFFFRCTRNETTCLWPLSMSDLCKKLKLRKSAENHLNFWVDWQMGDSFHRFLKDMTKDYEKPSNKENQTKIFVFEKYGINKDFDDNGILASYYVINHDQGNSL